MEVLPPWAAEGRKLWPVNSVATLDKAGEAHALFPPSEKSEDFWSHTKGPQFFIEKKKYVFLLLLFPHVVSYKLKQKRL